MMKKYKSFSTLLNGLGQGGILGLDGIVPGGVESSKQNLDILLIMILSSHKLLQRVGDIH